MNERIEKLALKFANRTGNSVLVNAEIFKEFAELIVKECIKQVNAIHPLEVRSDWGQNTFAEDTIKR